MRRYLLPALLAAAFATPFIPSAVAQTPISLDQAMAQPDWIGTPVEAAWWGWDSKTAYYKQKRLDSPLRDTFVAGAVPRKVGEAELANLDSERVVYNRERSRAIVLRHGDLFERDLKTGALTQIRRDTTAAAAPQFSADGKAVQFRVGHDWFSWSRADKLIVPLALPRAMKDPAAAPDEDALRAMQLRLIATLKRQKDDRDATRAENDAQRRADATRAPAPVYLGEKIAIDASALSPDGRWLVVATSPKSPENGRVGKMPRYVTESGYEEFDDQRTRVGRNLPLAQTLRLIDLKDNSVHELALDPLPGIATDPLAAMRAERKLEAVKGNRASRLDEDGAGDGIVWTPNGAQVALMIRAVDNKDRWIATVDLAHARLKPLHHLADKAWVNNSYNEFGWLPDSATLWFLSEESGYSHLYTVGADGKQRALTGGNWEATDVTWNADGSAAWLMCNRKTPGDYEVCNVDAKTATVREVSQLGGGVEDFTVSPDQKKLLVRWSSAYVPPQLASVPAQGGTAVRLTDTRSAGFKAREWVQPEFVAVPSTHNAGQPVWAKLYKPARLEPGKKYPVVMFVHGAGYLQNVSKRYTPYFREQMFHNLLVEKGYIVLDMDYRASKGYGRDWRTAIYRQMGHPELEDYVDGAKWLAANQQGDIDRVGIYGGSYGGFMTFMALMREPALFKAGAALRPVTDWTTYNHGYTANILNTPDIDPEAYKVSSPIEYADQLQGHLLIAHGMVDDNVFYQDSVRMAQRLIELKKDNWELASYPLERHGFVQPESWYDEYRRIFKLFEDTLK